MLSAPDAACTASEFPAIYAFVKRPGNEGRAAIKLDNDLGFINAYDLKKVNEFVLKHLQERRGTPKTKVTQLFEFYKFA